MPFCTNTNTGGFFFMATSKITTTTRSMRSHSIISLFPLFPLLLLLSSLYPTTVDAFLLQSPPPPRSTPRRTQPLSMSSPSTTVASASSSSIPIRQQIVILSTGLPMEVVTATPPSSSPLAFPSPFSALFQPKSKQSTRPPLVFLHGSFHSSWCWSEHFLPYFASKGYDCYALSFRGTSRSPSPSQESSITINTHAADLRAFLQTTFPPSSSSSPIIIGHSFGGAILMKLLEQQPSPPLSGAAFLCSVPPSGNGPMTARFLKRDLLLALKIVLGFVAKKAAQWDWLCRELFFTPALPPALLREYKERLALDSVVAIDVKDFLKELPSLKADEETGMGRWVGQVPHRLVIGAEFDKLVDKEGVDEMAAFADAGAPVFLPLAHDVMLGPEWPIAAGALLKWVEGLDNREKGSRR